MSQAARDCPLLEQNLEGWIVCCSKRFFPLARRVAGDDSLAEDVLQTSWIKILQSIGHAHFDKPKACPWVKKIVHNTAEDVRRGRSRRGEVLLPQLEDMAPSPELVAQKREMLILVGEMVKMLPDTYRRVLELRAYEGLTSQQTADYLHISRSSVSMRLNRAIRMLKSRLEEKM